VIDTRVTEGCIVLGSRSSSGSSFWAAFKVGIASRDHACRARSLRCDGKSVEDADRDAASPRNARNSVFIFAYAFVFLRPTRLKSQPHDRSILIPRREERDDAVIAVLALVTMTIRYPLASRMDNSKENRSIRYSAPIARANPSLTICGERSSANATRWDR